ncbi:hypothetical protein F2Q69_00048721 [Brassica cretica]|uniref:Uncharacterized protein n=1 Tax=Brassica cretica TaxID=69181 RepID=A0A8S9PIJ9_BRACR|nr:hypothetical protein F2Q69_00048721 [Brassica cretica]
MNNNLRLATCDQSQIAGYATAKRTTTCDLRPATGRAIGQAVVKLRFRRSLCRLRRPSGLPFSFAFLCSSLSVGPRRSAASTAGPSFSSGVDLERYLHRSQAVGL